MWAYLLFISLCGFSCWWILTALQLCHNGNLASVKALPRADAASHQKCLATFFRQHLWNNKQRERTSDYDEKSDGMWLISFKTWRHPLKYCLFNNPFMGICLHFKQLPCMGFLPVIDAKTSSQVPSSQKSAEEQRTNLAESAVVLGDWYRIDGVSAEQRRVN